MNNSETREKEIATMKMEWQLIFEIPITYEKVDRFLGITIEMHTNEMNHLGSPHCHAKYRDKEISISLKDYSVLVSNGMDFKHQKMAIQYVKEHIDYLTELWNRNPNCIKI